MLTLSKLSDLLALTRRLGMAPDEYEALRTALLGPVAPGGMPLDTFEAVVDRRPA